ncbi:MAG: CIA30 family protein [Planctomycetes bacterium]|nr:CIA30 family protein [Planctomycetota bacterium]
MERSRVVDFTASDAARGWSAIDDVVMGGVSASRLALEGDRTVFSGRVSLDHGGGFASVRSAPSDFALAGFDGLELELAGDGRRYRLNARLDAAFDGVTYQAEFVAPRARSSVRIPFTELRPTWRGRPVPDAAPFDPARVATLGLLIGARQAGDFRLELFALDAYRASRR